MPSSFRPFLALAFLLIVTLASHHKLPAHSSHQSILTSKHQIQKQEQEQPTKEDPLQALSDPDQLLHSIDADGDGQITAQELTTYIQTLVKGLGGTPPNAEDIHAVFEVLDLDHDELIGPEEFGGLTQLILSIREGEDGGGIIHQSGSGAPPETSAADILLEKSHGQSLRSEKWRYFSLNPDYPEGSWVFYGNWGIANNDDPWNNCLKNCPTQALQEGRAFDGRSYVCVRHEDVRIWGNALLQKNSNMDTFLQKTSGVDAGDAIGAAVIAITRAIIFAANPVRCYYQRWARAASVSSELIFSNQKWWYYTASSNKWCYNFERPLFEGKQPNPMCLSPA